MSAQARRLVSGGDPKKVSAACQRGKLIRHSLTHSPLTLWEDKDGHAVETRCFALWGWSRGVCIYHV